MDFEVSGGGLVSPRLIQGATVQAPRKGFPWSVTERSFESSWESLWEADDSLSRILTEEELCQR